MSKGQLSQPPAIAIQRPIRYWQELAARIASGESSNRTKVAVEQDETLIDNYGNKSNMIRDPGARNESDPDRFSISSAMSSVNQLLSRL